MDGRVLSPKRLRLLAWLETRLEARIYSSAAAITALDPVCLQTPLREARNKPPVKIIPNGYDEDDFQREPKQLPRWSIVHTGNLHAGRSLDSVWAIIEECLKIKPDLGGKLHFWQLGTVDDYVMDQIDNPPSGLNVHYMPPVPMKEAIQYMLGADLLLVISYDSGGNIPTIPAKIYQYLRANRPILGICAEEAVGLREAAQDASSSCCCTPGEHRKAAEYVVAALDPANRVSPAIGPDIEKYSRREQAGQLAEMLEIALQGS